MGSALSSFNRSGLGAFRRSGLGARGFGNIVGDYFAGNGSGGSWRSTDGGIWTFDSGIASSRIIAFNSQRWLGDSGYMDPPYSALNAYGTNTPTYSFPGGPVSFAGKLYTNNSAATAGQWQESDDNGASWDLVTAPNSGSGSTPRTCRGFYVSGGTLYILMLGNTSSRYYFVWTTDGTSYFSSNDITAFSGASPSFICPYVYGGVFYVAFNGGLYSSSSLPTFTLVRALTLAGLSGNLAFYDFGTDQILMMSTATGGGVAVSTNGFVTSHVDRTAGYKNHYIDNDDSLWAIKISNGYPERAEDYVTFSTVAAQDLGSGAGSTGLARVGMKLHLDN